MKLEVEMLNETWKEIEISLDVAEEELQASGVGARLA